jgi:hypothetical protein
MIIADEVDAQLTQTMESFGNGAPKSAKPQLVKPKGLSWSEDVASQNSEV